MDRATWRGQQGGGYFPVLGGWRGPWLLTQCHCLKQQCWPSFFPGSPWKFGSCWWALVPGQDTRHAAMGWGCQAAMGSGGSRDGQERRQRCQGQAGLHGAGAPLPRGATRVGPARHQQPPCLLQVACRQKEEAKFLLPAPAIYCQCQ